MKTKIDLKSWNRKEHFEFFLNFDEPFFGLTTKLDCSIANDKAKKEGFSLYVYYLYQSIKAANRIPNFRYRIIDGEVSEFDTIHTSTIGLRKDNTFAFTFVPYSESFDEFVSNAQKEKEAVLHSTGLRLNENFQKDGCHALLHASMD